MSNAFQQRLGAFRSKFQQVLGGRSSQYEELSTLEAPLVGNENSHVPGDSDQVDSYGAPRPEGYHSGRPVEQTVYPGRSGATSQHAVPSQGDELRLLAGLANDAAGLLFELAAMQDSGDAAKEMLTKSEQLQAQLRGMIGDAQNVDEQTMAGSLEAFEALSRTLEEYKGADHGSKLPASTGAYPQAGTQSSTGTGTRLAPPPGGSGAQQPGPEVAAGRKIEDEAPLIQF